MVEHLAVGACLGDRQPLLLKPLLLLIAAALLASYERFRIIECAKTLPM